MHQRLFARLARLLAFGACLSAPPAFAQGGGAEVARPDERTAHTIGAQRLKLGLLGVDYGVVDSLSIGVDPIIWGLRVVLPIWIPNAHAKLRLIELPGVSVALRGAVYYTSLSSPRAEVDGSLWIVPVSAVASLSLGPRLSLHPEATYVIANASGSGDLDDADVNGAVAAEAAQAGAMLQYRATRVLSFTAVGRYQLYSGPLVFQAEDALDSHTTARVDAELTPRVERPWQLIGGIMLTWPSVRVALGVGYGHLFVPGLDIALPWEGIVPDLSLAVVL